MTALDFVQGFLVFAACEACFENLKRKKAVQTYWRYAAICGVNPEHSAKDFLPLGYNILNDIELNEWHVFGLT